MPLHVFKFLQDTPEIIEVELDLVQGRWHENFMKRVTLYSNRQYMIPDFNFAEPGLAIKFKTQTGELSTEANDRLFGFLSTMFSLGILEQRKDYLILKNFEGSHFFYFSKPYESFCKENLSVLLKLIANFNYESGLRPLISDSVLHSSSYKHLNFKINHTPN